MAKYRRHGNSKGAVVTIVALLLALVVLVIGIGSSWFTNGDVRTWFNSWGQGTQESDNSDKKPPIESNLIITPEEVTFGLVQLAVTSFNSDGASAQAEDSATVTVLNPQEGYTYTWSLSSGGSTYIDLSSTTGTSVNVTAKQAFGTQITLTCTAALDGVVASSAICKLDYFKRPTGVWFGGDKGAYRADGSSLDIGTIMSVTGIESAIKTGKLDFTVPTNKSVFQFGTGSVDYGTAYYNMTISESTSGLSWLFARYVPGNQIALSKISFSELYFRHLKATEDSEYTVGEYNMYLMGLDYRTGATFNNEYNKLKGKTFIVTVNVFNSDKSERNTTLTYNFTIPANWAVAYSVEVPENIVL